MSIIRMLTRLTAVAALRGTTWADDRVFDSDNTPLGQALVQNEAAKPYIVVFTDSDSRSGVDGTDVYTVDRELNLVIEVGVASKITGETGEAVLKIPQTDEGMEIALDMVEDQALASLFGNPRNEWAELLKGLVIRVMRISGQRGAAAERDRRWAARQLSIICDTQSDLPPGVAVPANHPIRKFAEISKRNPEAHMEHAAEICEALCSRTAAPGWEQLQAVLGVRREGLRAIGKAPLSSDLPAMATGYGDDLTDSKGEAPILRKLGYDDIQMPEGMEEIGLIDVGVIQTDVVVIKPTEKKDKVKIDGG